ncbi:MAG TPA: hypothetical protein LFV91_02605 [Rickettsia endosymbiont of Bembidion nr. Transversale]|nr:hypothetical protein [Rickettsia endosymbiont of Bembidion nr. Transversale]
MSKLREQISLSSNDPSGIEEIKKVLSEDKPRECYKEIYSDDFNSIKIMIFKILLVIIVYLSL